MISTRTGPSLCIVLARKQARSQSYALAACPRRNAIFGQVADSTGSTATRGPAGMAANMHPEEDLHITVRFAGVTKNTCKPARHVKSGSAVSTEMGGTIQNLHYPTMQDWYGSAPASRPDRKEEAIMSPGDETMAEILLAE